MKKILCFMLALLLSFNSVTCYVYAEDFSGSSTDYGTPSNAKPITESPEYEKVQKNIDTVMKAFFTAIRPEYASALWGDDISNYVQSESVKDNNVTTDGNYYYISANFINNINQKVQDNIHVLDGYYYIEPVGSLDSFTSYVESISSYRYSESSLKNLDYYLKNRIFFLFRGLGNVDDPSVFTEDSNYLKNNGYENDLMYIDSTDKNQVYFYHNSSFTSYPTWEIRYAYGNCVSGSGSYYMTINDFKNMPLFSNHAIKIFYSKQDLTNYVNKGRQYYAPNLPFSNIRIPVTYINNTNELPDFDFNFDKLIGKTENEIQTNIDATLKAYLDHLVKLNNTSSKPTPTVPAVRVTPTPDIGDRPITPSPTPPVTDDTSSTDKLLEQIYDWLLDFGDKHETFVELITQYIENTDGKLDQIIEAIDKLSQGSTEGEVNGCKYDYTALSEFLTQLWNESDKKFDKMVELLEENNEYQQKIVDSLNQIKALLVADTVLDVFKNRSTETANKAKEKFPTSLPWDIAMVVNAFSATPKDPVIELPIKIASMHIDEKIVVDLSSEEWAKLAKTCRYLLSILFVLYMIHLSRKFFSKGDE
ncbi:hypothetical protein [Blautia obeum]|uniref:Uncharacterized protein n=1 Tax=Blautia obeum TaxID=40520 RepID=A0A564UJC3_9FIRM|nr:hypothetical protein [Blautia obeum]VUX19352.1 Uncharacterised protein [Blautia obeum]